MIIVREFGDRKGEADALGNLGVAHGQLGETQQAIQFFEQALLIDHEIGDRRGEGIDLWNMGLALDQLGERSRAIQFAEQSLTILEQLEDPLRTTVSAKLAEWHHETSKK